MLAPYTTAENKRVRNSNSLRTLDMVAGMGFEPHELRVMSPTSYQTALPRDVFPRFSAAIFSIHQRPLLVNTFLSDSIFAQIPPNYRSH